jgi:hypothetical protein
MADPNAYEQADLTTFLTSQRREINAVLGDVRVVHAKVVAGRTGEAVIATEIAIRRLNDTLEAQDAAVTLHRQHAAEKDLEVKG